MKKGAKPVNRQEETRLREMQEALDVLKTKAFAPVAKPTKKKGSH